MRELLAMSCHHPARWTSARTPLASHAKEDGRNRGGRGVTFYRRHGVALYREITSRGCLSAGPRAGSQRPGNDLVDRLQDNVKTYRTVDNTVAPGTHLTGLLKRAQS